MSFDGFPHDSFDRPLFLRPTIRPILYQSHFCPRLCSRHRSKSTVFFKTSIGAPFVSNIGVPFIPSIRTPRIPSIKAPRIPSIKAPRIPNIKATSIPHCIIPGTTRYIPPGERQDKKQTGSAWLNSRDEYSVSRNESLSPVHLDDSPMVLGPALRLPQESESVSSSGSHCRRVICAQCCLAGYPSQGCATKPLSTEYTTSVPHLPLVFDTDRSKGGSVDDSTIERTTPAAIPVTHVAMGGAVPLPLGFRQCENGLSVSFGCTRSSYARTGATGGK